MTRATAGLLKSNKKHNVSRLRVILKVALSTAALGKQFQYRVIMNGFIKLLTRSLFLTAILMFGGILPSYAADLQRFSNAQLINNPANDGDSFLVEANGKSFHVRLYFVDCPETSVSSKSDAQRVREQTRYFGLSDAVRTIHFGNEAVPEPGVGP